MTRTQRGVWPQLVFVAAVAALVVFVFLARPARGADFVVRPAGPANAFAVKPAGRVVAGQVEEATNRTYPNAPPAYSWVLFTDGVYRLLPVRPPQVMPAPGVPAAPTFHRSHTCPQCGLSQYVVERFNPDGTHTHRCARGHEWRH